MVGPGDDAAVIKAEAGSLVATTDCLVEGTHFRLSWERNLPKGRHPEFWRSLGWKVMVINLSDLAAMGDVRSSWALVTVGLPAHLHHEEINWIHRGLMEASRRFHVSIAGGDTVRSKFLFLSVAMVGKLQGRAPRLRNGARIGDRVAVTGRLGDARAGLDLLQESSRGRQSWRRLLLNRFFFPSPRLREGRELGRLEGVTALMDMSDGLWRSLELLSESSHVGYHVEGERLPVSPTLIRWATERKTNPFAWAAAGGEDYELLFTYKPGVRARLWSRLAFTDIGQVVDASRGKRLLWKGKPFRSLPVFEHFS